MSATSEVLFAQAEALQKQIVIEESKGNDVRHLEAQLSEIYRRLNVVLGQLNESKILKG
jgi:hypothetical protein